MTDLSAIKADFTTYPDRLKALRDRLVDELEDAPASVVAPLTKQLMDVLAKLEEVAPARTESVLDDLATARARRRADAGL
jgi:hypothetical protein